MDTLNFKTIVKRLKAKTPPFWAAVRRWMITCGAVGGALLAAPADYLSWLPESLSHVPHALATIGVVGTALSSLTVDQPKQ
jgi:hypothetical protein